MPFNWSCEYLKRDYEKNFHNKKTNIKQAFTKLV